jgi:uncharacterized protein YkwD
MPGSRRGRSAAFMPAFLLAAVMSVVLVAAMVPAAVGTRRAKAQLTARIARAEDEIVSCANGARLAHGLRPLRQSSVLRHAAKYHARNMRRYHFFRHDDVFGQSPADRVARFARRGAFRWVGENIAVGYWSAADVCREWMASDEHRANILNRHFGLIGVGYARTGDGRTYFVQDFGSHQAG